MANDRYVPPAWLPIDDWDTVPPKPQEWTVPDRIPRRQVCLFSGEGGSGKSLIGLQLCCAHAAAKEWLGLLPEPGPAFYLDAEDERNQIGLRLEAITSFHGVSFTELSQNGLYVMPLAGQQSLLAVVTRGGVVKPTSLYDHLLNQARLIKPETIVIASLANVYAGSEIDRGQVTQFVGFMTQLAIEANGSVILISHPSLAGQASETGISGSTSWHNAVRARMYLHGVKTNGSEASDPALRVLEWKKNQYGDLQNSITLRWRNGLYLQEGQPAMFDKAAKEATGDHVFETLLKRYAREGRTVSPNKKAPNYAPAEFVDQPEAKLAHLSKRDLQAAMDRLFQRLVIKAATSGPPSKQRTKIVHTND